MKKFSKFLAVIVFAFVAVGSSLLTISCANNAGGGGSGSESSTGEIAIGTESTGGGVVAPSPSILDTIETKYTVVLDNFDAAKKIPVIKAVREVTGLGLGESKSLVENAPKVVKEGVDKDAAEEFVTKITLAGGYVTKKPTYSVTAENVAEVIRAMTQSGSVEVTGPITDSTLVEIKGALADLYGNRQNVLVGVDLRRTYGVDTFAYDEFYGCNNLVNIGIPASVTNIFGMSRSGRNVLWSGCLPAFYGCENLYSIDVANNNSVYKSIGGVLYSKDEKILVRYPIGKESSYFRIPDTVESIARGAIYGCEKITKLSIPEGINEIADNGIANCSNLAYIEFSGSVSQWKAINILGQNGFYGIAAKVVHCCDGETNVPKGVLDLLG